MRKFNGKAGTVHAAKILDITQNEGDLILDSGRVSHTKDWHRQHGPQIGEWYVMDENGNARAMSSSEFKSEYTQQPDTTIPVVSADRHAERDERADAAAARPRTKEQSRADEQREQLENDRGRRPATVADAQVMENANRQMREAEETISRPRDRR